MGQDDGFAAASDDASALGSTNADTEELPASSYDNAPTWASWRKPSISDLLLERGIGHRSNGSGQPHTLFWISTGEEIGKAHADDALDLMDAALAKAERAADPVSAYGSRKHEGEAEVTNTDEVQQ